MLKNAIIEVKKGNGKGLTKQVTDRLDLGLPVIGFSPKLGPSAMKSINGAGGITAGGAASSLDDLIELVKP